MAGDPSLTPEQIQARSFSSGFRGYDQAEVREFLTRVAIEVRSLRERADQLDAAWHSAEERASRPPVLDEEMLVAAVGDETAGILRAARAAASELRQRGEEDAARLVAEAEGRAGQLRAEAETVMGRETHAAEEAATRIIDTAKSQAADTVEKAKADAQCIRAAAEQERTLTIEGAVTSRERILEDLARRRRVASVQIEQLRAGRERLLECYGVVRRTLEEVNDQLNRADAEARAAADEVGRRLQREHRAEAERGPTAASTAAPASGSAAADPATVTQAVAVVTTIIPDAPAPSEASAEPGSQVDVLFARIRAGQHEPGEPTEPTEAIEPAASTEADAPQDSGPEESSPDEERSGEPRLSDGDEALLQRRESAVIDLEVALTRKLKRTLQDEQNDLLDRLRNLRDQPTTELVLPDAALQIDRYAEAAQPLVDQAAAAGVAFADETLGLDPPTAGASPDVQDVAREAATSIVESLRRRLDGAISSGGDDPSGLVEAVGSAYREWKSERIERVAGDVLAAAFSRGTWNEVPDGTRLRWIVEDTDGPCPDCDDDALAGGLPKGEAFPTGQPYPPAHTGCRCLLVPIGD